MRNATDIAIDLLAGLPQGGATVHVSHGARVPDSGYVVALPGHTLRIASGERYVAGLVLAWVRANRAALDWGPRRYAGLWVDNGDVVLDVSEIYSERATAERVGRERGEIALWDIGAGQEITLLTGGEADARRESDAA